jgi:hypothetical protein
MKIRNNNPLDLKGEKKELITLKVKSTGTVHLVNQSLNGSGAPMEPDTPLRFRLNPDLVEHNAYVLVLFFTFSNTSGGVYEIEVTGSKGGISNYTITQFPGQAANAIAYTFDIV